MQDHSEHVGEAEGLPPDRFQILAPDGGGAKALFTAHILARLEQDLNVSISDSFDLIAGTSAGGIVALALGREHDLYTFAGEQTSSWITRRIAGAKKAGPVLLGEIRPDGGLYRYEYESPSEGFVADLPVDADRLVLDYSGIFKRVHPD